MKRWTGMVALVASFGFIATLSAEEPHLEFVRALRARQYHDLAMEYLQKISTNASPELARELPLEFARTRLELAKVETDVGRRVGLYAQARKDLEAVIKKNPEKEGEAQLEIAQVAVLQGKAQLSRALRAEGEARKAEIVQARGILEDAGNQLDAAAKRIDAQLAKLGEPKTPKDVAEKKALQQARMRADFDRGVNYYDQAQTIPTDGAIKVLERRNELLTQAEKILLGVGDGDENNALYWQAAAWVGRCYHQKGEAAKARNRYENIITKAPPNVGDTGRRLAAYFRILLIPETTTGKDNPLDAQQQACEQWLTQFRPYVLTTPEGPAVAFRLAEIYFEKGSLLKDPKEAKTKAAFYDRAKELYRQLEQTDNDFTSRASDRKIQITFAAQGGPVGDVTKFQTFDDCYVRAQYEAFKLNEDPKEIKDPKELEKKKKERFTTIITALNRGIKLAADAKLKVPERELLNAQSMLAFAYMTSTDYANAVKTSEVIVYAKPQSTQASTAAIYALEAYLQLVTDPMAEPAQIEEHRKGMLKLVDFIKDRWADEPVGEYARHQMGLQMIREKKLPEGIAELASIKPTYPNIILVKWQIASAANQAEQDKAEPIGPDKRPFKEQALAALETMPDLPVGADASTSHIWVSAKIQIGQNLYGQKKFKEMEAMAKPLLDRLEKMTLPDDAREPLKTGLSAMILYARYGQAEADYSAGKYAEVKKTLDPVVAEAKAGKLPELKSIPDLRWALLGLALRANVMENNMKQAQEVLTVLQSYTDAKEGTRIEAILQPIVLTMNRQIEELRRKEQQALLDKTIKSFSEFLDILLKAQQKPSQEFLFVMGQSYIGLGRFTEAAKVFGQIPAPPNDDEKENRLYRAARLLYVKALREAKQLDEAGKTLEAIKAEPWGKQNLEAMKEEGHLMDAKGLHGNAATHWNGLMKSLQGRVTTDPNAKEQYFEIYYYLVRSYYKFGQVQTDAAKKDKYIKAAGNFIFKLEAAWPDLGGETAKQRFTDLMNKEAPLKAAYEEYKKENKG